MAVVLSVFVYVVEEIERLLKDELFPFDISASLPSLG